MTSVILRRRVICARCTHDRGFSSNICISGLIVGPVDFESVEDFHVDDLDSVLNLEVGKLDVEAVEVDALHTGVNSCGQL